MRGYSYRSLIILTMLFIKLTVVTGIIPFQRLHQKIKCLRVILYKLNLIYNCSLSNIPGVKIVQSKHLKGNYGWYKQLCLIALFLQFIFQKIFA